MSKERNGKMRRISLASAITLILGALVLAGCGGSGGGSGTGTSTTTATAGEGGEQAKFEISEEDRQCLKEKGVELPEFKAGEGPQTFQKGAMPEGGGVPGGGELPEGVEPPRGGTPPEGGPPGEVGGPMGEEDKKAFEECGVEMPEFKVRPGGAGGPDVNSAAFKKRVREYVACVRENGYDLADPNFSGEGPIFDRSESESDAFKKASEQCQSLLGEPSNSRSG